MTTCRKTRGGSHKALPKAVVRESAETILGALEKTGALDHLSRITGPLPGAFLTLLRHNLPADLERPIDDGKYKEAKPGYVFVVQK